MQSETIDLADVRALFDNLISDFPLMEKYLSPDSNIVAYKSFESAVVKLQNSQPENLDDDEERVVQSLKVSVSISTNIDVSGRVDD